MRQKMYLRRKHFIIYNIAASVFGNPIVSMLAKCIIILLMWYFPLNAEWLQAKLARVASAWYTSPESFVERVTTYKLSVAYKLR